MTPLLVDGIKFVDVTKGGTERCWNEAYSIRPALGFIHHFIQGGRWWIGKPDTGCNVSSHFTIDANDLEGNGELWQNVPLNLVAWTNGGINRPTWPLVSEVPFHYSKRKGRKIQDGNRPTFTCEAAGFVVVPYSYSKEKWLGLPAETYHVYGEHNVPDKFGRAMKDFPEHLIAAQIECTMATFDLGLMKYDPSEETITGHFALDSVNRPHDPNMHWREKWLPHIISTVRGKQPKLPDSSRIARAEMTKAEAAALEANLRLRKRIETRKDREKRLTLVGIDRRLQRVERVLN